MDADSGLHSAGYRSAPLSGLPGVIDPVVFGTFRLDSERRVLTSNGREVALQPRAFDLLALLVGCRGQTLSSDEIIGQVWRGVAVGDNNLGVQLSTLRRVLAEHGGKGLIVTVPGQGYRFVGDTHREPSSAVPHPAGAPAPPRVHSSSRRGARLSLSLAAAATVVLVFGLATLGRRSSSPASAVLESFNPPPRSVAVLAFANLSSDPAQDYLSDGLSEAVIDTLSRVNQLQVTARTSSFYFKGHAATIDQIARHLNVGTVLEGSLRRQGPHLRIDTHLSDARTGFQIWSKSYDLAVADMLKLQDEIAGDVADALQAKLLDTEAARRSLGGTTNPQAFDAYLRAERHVREGYDERYEALAEFRKSTEMDPDFAWALIGLSRTIEMVLGYDTSIADPSYATLEGESRRAAERAVSLAPGLGLAHAQLAAVLAASDVSAAWTEVIRARALTPGDVSVEEVYAAIAMKAGRRDEAMTAASRAVELDPLQPEAWFTSMRALSCAGKFDAAIHALQRGNDVRGHPSSWSPYIMGSLLLKQGKPDAARRICETSTDWTPQCLAIAYHALGRQADAEANLARMRAQTPLDDNAYNFAEIYAQWNQPAAAMHWLNRAREVKDPALIDIECDAFLDPVRGQPGFQQIEQSLHLPPAN